MDPLARLGTPVPPLPPSTTCLVASSAPWRSPGLAGTLGLLLHPWGPLWLPNSAGLVRYGEEKPQVGAGACFHGGHAPGVLPETGSE